MDIKQIYWAQVDKAFTDYWDDCEGCKFFKVIKSHHPYQEGYATETHKECIADKHCPGMDSNQDLIAEEIFNCVKECDSCKYRVGDPDDQICLIANGDVIDKCPAVVAAGF